MDETDGAASTTEQGNPQEPLAKITITYSPGKVNVEWRPDVDQVVLRGMWEIGKAQFDGWYTHQEALRQAAALDRAIVVSQNGGLGSSFRQLRR